MKRLFFIAVIFFIGCHTSQNYPDGGYAYPEHISGEDTNFYYYPIRKFLSKKDSFYCANSYLLFRAFHEPNLSIRPLDKETFRLDYSDAFGETILISLTEDEIVAKKGSSEMISDEQAGEKQLTALEKYQLRFLQSNYPIDTTGKPAWKKRFLDSMTTRYPELLDPQYYRKLLFKSWGLRAQPLPYAVSVIPLKKGIYDSLVRQINASGYWSLPYDLPNIDSLASMDGFAFTLEANTRQKYQYVSATNASGDTSLFVKACQRLIEYAKMDKEIPIVSKGGRDSIVVQNVQLENMELPKKKHHRGS